jgi:glycosyltransferase involved in cell wall biosynthesis
VMGRQDGVDYLLKALQHLAYDLKRTDFFCLLMGKGDALNDLKQLAHDLKLDDYVLFTGWVENTKVQGYLSAMDLCVAPEPSNEYNDRSTMIKITEYMAAGKAIAAFDLPEHRYTAQNAAVYAGANDPRELAHAILALMDDPERRDALGSAGRQRIETQLAWTYQADNLLKVYESLSTRLLAGRSISPRERSL